MEEYKGDKNIWEEEDFREKLRIMSKYKFVNKVKIQLDFILEISTFFSKFLIFAGVKRQVWMLVCI